MKLLASKENEYVDKVFEMQKKNLWDSLDISCTIFKVIMTHETQDENVCDRKEMTLIIESSDKSCWVSFYII